MSGQDQHQKEGDIMHSITVAVHLPTVPVLKAGHPCVLYTVQFTSVHVHVCSWLCVYCLSGLPFFLISTIT